MRQKNKGVQSPGPVQRGLTSREVKGQRCQERRYQGPVGSNAMSRELVTKRGERRRQRQYLPLEEGSGQLLHALVVLIRVFNYKQQKSRVVTSLPQDHTGQTLAEPDPLPGLLTSCFLKE